MPFFAKRKDVGDSMKKSVGAKPLIYPQPVLLVATYDQEGQPDIMNVAYGGIVNSNRLQINIGIRHKTSDNIKSQGEFTVGLGTKEILEAADYVGIVSGKDDPDKVKKSGLTLAKSEVVHAPIIKESPIILECKVEEINQYDQTLRIVAEILDVKVEENILKDDQTVDTGKLEIITYDASAHDYLLLGKKVGKAFCDGNHIKDR